MPRLFGPAAYGPLSALSPRGPEPRRACDIPRLHAGVEDRHDAGVDETGSGDGLPPEPLPQGRVRAQVGHQDFDCHTAREHLVLALPNFRHTASGQWAHQVVAAGQHAWHFTCEARHNTKATALAHEYPVEPAQLPVG